MEFAKNNIPRSHLVFSLGNIYEITLENLNVPNKLKSPTTIVAGNVASMYIEIFGYDANDRALFSEWSHAMGNSSHCLIVSRYFFTSLVRV